MTKIRVDGWSALGVGVQWSYFDSNANVAKRVLVDLEDRRVLFDPYGRENALYCIHSALEIRHLMKVELGNVEQGDDLDGSLREIRLAARDFIEHGGPDGLHYDRDLQRFWRALEVMRSRMGPEIRSIAAAYNYRLPDDIDRHLPLQDLSFIATTFE